MQTCPQGTQTRDLSSSKQTTQSFESSSSLGSGGGAGAETAPRPPRPPRPALARPRPLPLVTGACRWCWCLVGPETRHHFRLGQTDTVCLFGVRALGRLLCLLESVRFGERGVFCSPLLPLPRPLWPRLPLPRQPASWPEPPQTWPLPHAHAPPFLAWARRRCSSACAAAEAACLAASVFAAPSVASLTSCALLACSFSHATPLRRPSSLPWIPCFGALGPPRAGVPQRLVSPAPPHRRCLLARPSPLPRDTPVSGSASGRDSPRTGLAFQT